MQSRHSSKQGSGKKGAELWNLSAFNLVLSSVLCFRDILACALEGSAALGGSPYLMLFETYLESWPLSCTSPKTPRAELSLRAWCDVSNGHCRGYRPHHGPMNALSSLQVSSALGCRAEGAIVGRWNRANTKVHVAPWRKIVFWAIFVDTFSTLVGDENLNWGKQIPEPFGELENTPGWEARTPWGTTKVKHPSHGKAIKWGD